MYTESNFVAYWRALNAALVARGKRPAGAGMAHAAWRHMGAAEAAGVIPATGAL